MRKEPREIEQSRGVDGDAPKTKLKQQKRRYTLDNGEKTPTNAKEREKTRK